MNVIAILDVGKTNKKIFLFDEDYKIVWEQTHVFPETKDEEGEPCEDLEKLTAWVKETIANLTAKGNYTVRAINFSAYGASFVHLDEDGRPVTPLYNYLKPFPPALKDKFYSRYGGEVTFSMLTASPVLGSLNSGMQIYRIKEENPDLFNRIKCSLHLPQFLSWLITGEACSDITSIGCHTNLWNFSQHHYHEWVYRETIIDKLAPVFSSVSVLPVKRQPDWPEDSPLLTGCVAGIGLHDSSAAMIPYLESFREPFVLISTGTWCISMNPFNQAPLTVSELQKDCLCYMSYQGKPVKASRLFAGYEHEQQVRSLAAHFQKSQDYYCGVAFDPLLVASLSREQTASAGNGPASSAGDRPSPAQRSPSSPLAASAFADRKLSAFRSYEEAYHRLLMDIMDQQIAATQLVLEGTDTKRIFVDGGFGRNLVYMHLLAAAFPHIEVFAASIPQASAMGAALAIHRHWNSKSLPGDIIELKYYTGGGPKE
ncbi:MAG TPA: FGGY family carbohydrate kinase [Puia sp.]|nr:FGGY family carbohydrate kinase [Puia sp.]